MWTSGQLFGCFICVCVCVCFCVHTRVHACVWVCVYVIHVIILFSWPLWWWFYHLICFRKAGCECVCVCVCARCISIYITHVIVRFSQPLWRWFCYLICFRKAGCECRNGAAWCWRHDVLTVREFQTNGESGCRVFFTDAATTCWGSLTVSGELWEALTL